MIEAADAAAAADDSNQRRLRRPRRPATRADWQRGGGHRRATGRSGGRKVVGAEQYFNGPTLINLIALQLLISGGSGRLSGEFISPEVRKKERERELNNNGTR